MGESQLRAQSTNDDNERVKATTTGALKVDGVMTGPGGGPMTVDGAVTVAQDAGNNDLPLELDASGNLKVLIDDSTPVDVNIATPDPVNVEVVGPLGHDGTLEINATKSAFGELIGITPSPVVQVMFSYNLNPRQLILVGTSGGTTYQADQMGHASTGTNAAGEAHIHTKDFLKYNPAQGAISRFSAIFTTGVANSEQYAGVGDPADGFFFGYNGATFGILKRKGGIQEIQDLTITTGAASPGNITITVDGNVEVVAVTAGTAANVAKEIAEHDWSATGWTVELNDDVIEFIDHDPGNATGTFSLVDTDATGTVGAFAEIVAGVDATDTWTPQASWNKDVMDGTGPSGSTLDPTKNNVYEIRFQYLGAGKIDFSLEDPTTGFLIVIHSIYVAGINTATSINNPSLPLTVSAENLGNTSDLIVSTGSMGAFVEGVTNSGLAIQNGISNHQIGITSNTLTNVLAIRNARTFQNKTNRVIVFPDTMSAATDGGTKNWTFSLLLNPTIVGDEVWTSVNSDESVMQYLTTGSVMTGGIEVVSFQLIKSGGSEVFNLSNIKMRLLPTDVLAVAAISVGAGDASVSLGWKELI